MLKSLKLQSRNTVAKNYKLFFPLILLYEIILVINAGIFNFGEINLYLPLLSLLYIVSLLLIELVIIPVLKVMYFKIGISAERREKISFSEIKSFLTSKNIVNIVLINMIPGVLSLSNSFFKLLKDLFNGSFVYYIVEIFLLVLMFFISYKFFICNYCFALEEKNVRNTLGVSFKIMKRKFAKYIRYELSFVLWYLLFLAASGIVMIIFRSLTDTRFVQLATPSWFGIMLWFRPYKFTADLFYSKALLSENEKQ